MVVLYPTIFKEGAGFMYGCCTILLFSGCRDTVRTDIL
jgi:hypothetical protein